VDRRAIRHAYERLNFLLMRAVVAAPPLVAAALAAGRRLLHADLVDERQVRVHAPPVPAAALARARGPLGHAARHDLPRPAAAAAAAAAVHERSEDPAALADRLEAARVRVADVGVAP